MSLGRETSVEAGTLHGRELPALGIRTTTRLHEPARTRRASDRFLARPWTLPVLDFIALAVAVSGAFAWLGGESEGGLFVAAFPVFGVLALSARGAYTPRLRVTMLDTSVSAAGSISVAAMCTLALGLLVRSGEPASPLLFRAWLLGVAFLGVNRVLYTLEQQRLRSNGRRRPADADRRRRARSARASARRLERAPGVRPAPRSASSTPTRSADAVGRPPAPVLGDPATCRAVVERHGRRARRPRLLRRRRTARSCRWCGAARRSASRSRSSRGCSTPSTTG